MLRPLAVFAMLALTAEPALAVDQAAKAFVQGIYRVYETTSGASISVRERRWGATSPRPQRR